MRDHIFVLLIATLLAGSTALAVDEAPARPVSKLEREQEDIDKERGEATLRLALLIVVLVVTTGGSLLLLVYFLRVRRASGREYLLRDDHVEQIPTHAAPITMMATSSSFPSTVARQTNSAWLKSIESVPVTKTRDHFPSFQVRATYAGHVRRMARIYVLENELVVIDVGPCFSSRSVAGPALTRDVIADSIAASAAENTITINLEKLDQLNLKGLLDLATKDGNIRAPFTELTDLSIDVIDAESEWREGDGSTWREGRGSAWREGSGSTWREGAGSVWREGSGSIWREGAGSEWSQSARPVGVFQFRLLNGGAFTFDFISRVVLQDAIELLRCAIPRGLPLAAGLEVVTAPYAEDV